MNHKLPILIAATVGLSMLTTNISVNSVIARSTHENDYGGMGYGGYGGMPYGYGGMPYGYGGMGQGGAGPVIQEPVDTGNPHLDKAINKFYNCLSHTHEDPPTIQKTDNCYYQTLGSNGGRQT
ncbi:MAG TPA: hypothetical protein VEH06_02580 [Candidatus Bathyarchaeia archaeon]|nr:hypothetical protein [Candidatus Bathyarchaeia archaeon]